LGEVASSSSIDISLLVSLKGNMQKSINNKVYRSYREDRRFVVSGGDAVKLLSKIPADSVSLTLTSPPYCIGKAYETSTTVDDFLDTHFKILPEVLRVTKPGGSICWQIGYHVKNREVQPLDYFVYDVMKQFPVVKLRNRIVWSFGHGMHDTARFAGRHEVILWFTKGNDYYFDLDSVRVPQRYPGKRHYKGPKRGEFSGHPGGKNPSDIWEIPNVNANHREKTLHPCQFPIGLAERIVRALCPPDEVVLDPFAGVCTTGAAAALNGRRFIGCEIVDEYRSIGVSRIEQALRGTLSYRPIETPPFDPALAGAVGRKPDHFL
jgi:adenine-specific DNA-methyltransferase